MWASIVKLLSKFPQYVTEQTEATSASRRRLGWCIWDVLRWKLWHFLVDLVGLSVLNPMEKFIVNAQNWGWSDCEVEGKMVVRGHPDSPFSLYLFVSSASSSATQLTLCYLHPDFAGDGPDSKWHFHIITSCLFIINVSFCSQFVTNCNYSLQHSSDQLCAISIHLVCFQFFPSSSSCNNVALM